jgi:deoxyribodipyrimidine photo-lyase
MDTRIVWFRRDLRVADNPALTAALTGQQADTRIVPLFVLDPRLVRGSTMSPARLSYLCDALADLDRSLRDARARLVVRHGDARAVVPAVADELRAAEVHAAHDVTPFAAERDRAVEKSLTCAQDRRAKNPPVLEPTDDRVARCRGPGSRRGHRGWRDRRSPAP